jgi:hypothetical protein
MIVEISSRSRKKSEKPVAGKPKATVTRIHGTIGEFLEATFPPSDDDATELQRRANGEAFTEAEAVAMEYPAIREFVVHNGHAGTDEFAKAMQKWLQNINVVSRFAQTLCGKSKDEIIKVVRGTLKPSPDHPEITIAEEFYASLENGCKDAERLVRMIRAAQIRQLVAMSCAAAEMQAEAVS